MDAREFRHSKRRECERRLDERRLVEFSFDSAEWRQNIAQQYLMWPRMDRRALDRRAQERRNMSRRQRLVPGESSGRVMTQNNFRDILSLDEKTMLGGLFCPTEGAKN